ncbi:hypothetical protein TVAG_222580 [Trichomonas vaginalis G3]|uniref:Uncharacterized protein n=1 Tax=Trichomonas vaginalis (strain ATCC PRA-98 / G3) TaxID=412133 RepID=A2F5D4_TRIV3|nr:hypothetical protein TVAGG3_1031860 [Trichomonas vaginalis G3]EAX99897.1 hypothetical protein TVAG_222580 [Trichomonas vaginalis G3]KAI5492923.1 hypothetical protein TVAGG3_1031860 [Trichomonas vaginalis G3]|eukprot:XP_001312827.1 hypothetical protein [Trichomonas vaginalis G3]
MCKEVDADESQSNDGKQLTVNTDFPEPYNPEARPDENGSLRSPSHSTELIEKSNKIAASKGNPIEDMSVSS